MLLGTICLWVLLHAQFTALRHIYIHCSEDLHVLMFPAQMILYFISTAQKIHFILLQFLLLQSASYIDAHKEHHSMWPLWSSAECLLVCLSVSAQWPAILVMIGN